LQVERFGQRLQGLILSFERSFPSLIRVDAYVRMPDP
jgi:hypothetical protein